MVLFHKIIEVRDLADFNRGAGRLVIALDGGFIGVTAVNGDLLLHAVAANRLLQKPSGSLLIPLPSEQNVNRLAVRIHGPIPIAPLAFDPDVRLVHAPAIPHQPLAVVEHLFQRETIRQDPAVDRRVVNGHAALHHQCFDMPITQGIRQIPVHACEDHILWEMGSLEPDHGLSPMPRPESSQREIIRQRHPKGKLATEPFCGLTLDLQAQRQACLKSESHH
jgi:hypothetical protein